MICLMNYFNYHDMLQALIVAVLGSIFIFIIKNFYEWIRFKKFKSMIDKEYFDFIDFYLEKKDLDNLSLKIGNKARRLKYLLEKEISFFNFENSIKYVRLIDFLLVTYAEIDKAIKYGFRDTIYDKSTIDKENKVKISKINKIVENHNKGIDNYINFKSDKLVSDL